MITEGITLVSLVVALGYAIWKATKENGIMGRTRTYDATNLWDEE